MSNKKKSSANNNDSSVVDTVIKVGGIVLSGGLAVVTGVIEGVADAIGSTTNL
jgi:hypothetical protein